MTVLLIFLAIVFTLYALDCQKRDDAIANRYAGLFGEDPRKAKAKPTKEDRYAKWLLVAIAAAVVALYYWEKLQ